MQISCNCNKIDPTFIDYQLLTIQKKVMLRMTIQQNKITIITPFRAIPCIFLEFRLISATFAKHYKTRRF
jgi:hypothetical protein